MEMVKVRVFKRKRYVGNRGIIPFTLKCFTEVQNAGDAFGIAVANHFLHNEFKVSNSISNDSPNVLLLGSILEWADKRSLVAGAGFIAGNSTPRQPPREIISVRGPLTALRLQQIGVGRPELLADPGVLAPLIFPRETETLISSFSVLPHYVDIEHPWVELCREQGFPVIDPRADLSQVFDSIAKTECVISSSLHGIIFAHAFGKRALWIKLSNRLVGGDFKFLDYFLSLPGPTQYIAGYHVLPNSDPRELAKMAMPADQERLRSNALEALAILRTIIATVTHT